MQLHVRIYDEDLIRAFRRLAVVKFGKSRGSLSMAMEEAMRMWVARHLADTHTNSGHKNLPSGVMGRRLIQVMKELKNKIPENGGVVLIGYGMIRKAVEKYAGGDPRTWRKYKYFLEELEIIEDFDKKKCYLNLNKLKEVLEA